MTITPLQLRILQVFADPPTDEGGFIEVTSIGYTTEEIGAAIEQLKARRLVNAARTGSGLGEPGEWSVSSLTPTGRALLDAVGPEDVQLKRVAVLPKTCAKSFDVEVEHVPGFSVMGFHRVDCPYCGAEHHPQLPGDVVNVLKSLERD